MSGSSTQAPVPPSGGQADPGFGFRLRDPFVHAYGMHGLPLLKTLVSSTTLVILPTVSHTFLWQLPYACEGASPCAYATPHAPLAHVTVPSDAHGPGGTPGHWLAAVQPPSLPLLPVLPPVPLSPAVLLPLLADPPYPGHPTCAYLLQSPSGAVHPSPSAAAAIPPAASAPIPNSHSTLRMPIS